MLQKLAIVSMGLWFVVLNCSGCSRDDTSELTSEQSWSRALLSSTYEDPEERGTAVDNFVRALQCADSKAPVYVSFADSISGRTQIIANLNRLMDAAMTDVGLSRAQPRNMGSREIHDNDHLLHSILIRSMQKLPTGDELSDFCREYLGEADSDLGPDITSRLLIAAIAEDAGCLSAWFSLAVNADGRLKEIAIRRFVATDPKNALPYYLMAEDLLEREELPAAIDAILNGNGRTICRWYETPIPIRADVAYPDAEVFKYLNLVGTEVSTEGLRFILHTNRKEFAFASRFPADLREMGFALRKHARKLCDQDEYLSASRILLALHGMGHKFVQATPRDVELLTTGLLFTSGAGVEDLENILSTLGLDTELERVRAFKEKVATADLSIRQLTTRRELQDEDLVEIFTGHRDLVGEERQRIRSVLETFGLLR